jgi:hypothetical protein
MNIYDRVFKMDTRFGIWRYSERIRITYVAQGWLVVWDHQQLPPMRYDCQGRDHSTACNSVIHKLRELQQG